VALVARGRCGLYTKAVQAELAGASAVLVRDDPDAGNEFLEGAHRRCGIPLVLVSADVGRELAEGEGQVRLEISGQYLEVDEPSVVAELGPDDGEVVMLGAHLDSVPGSPGLNDDASGSAAVLELATQLAACTPSRLRVALWGGEELGLLGSSAYVTALDADARASIVAYVNLDMLGTPAFDALVGDGDGSAFGAPGPQGSAELEAILHEALATEGVDGGEAELDGRSDYAPFQRAGIPVATLQASRYNGQRNAPFDRCYHAGCDDLGNVDVEGAAVLARAAGRLLAERLAER
jgi:hypothetical protein